MSALEMAGDFSTALSTASDRVSLVLSSIKQPVNSVAKKTRLEARRVVPILILVAVSAVSAFFRAMNSVKERGEKMRACPWRGK